MENLSRIVTAVLILLILTIGASYTSAAPPDVSVAQQTIDPDPPAVSAVASDVGTARWMNDIESKRESRGIEPGAGRWKTWAISSVDAYRLPAPPDRKTTAAEIQQLKVFSSQRDAAARQQVAFWDAGAPSYRWVEIALNQLQTKPMTNPRIQRANGVDEHGHL